MGMFKMTPPPPVKGVAKKAAAPVKKAASRATRVEDDDGDDGDGEIVTSGWAGAKKMAAEHNNYASRLEMKDGETVIGRYGNDTGPYAVSATHWIARGTGKNVKRQSYLCPGSRKCPICATGDSPRVTYCYNFIQITDGDPVVWSFERGVRDHNQIESLAKEARYAPLSKKYYEIKRTGSKADDTRYSFKVVRKVSDLEEDWPDLRVPDEEEIQKLIETKLYTKDDALKSKVSMKTLEEVAAELLGEDPDDDDDE